MTCKAHKGRTKQGIRTSREGQGTEIELNHQMAGDLIYQAYVMKPL